MPLHKYLPNWQKKHKNICIYQKKVVLLHPVMMKRIVFILFALCCLCCGVRAENRWGVIDRPHEIRVGWGDQLFETLMWHKPTAIITSMPTTWQKTYKENFVYSQHIWVEYHYRFKYWVSFGGMIDGSGVQWDDVIRDGSGAEVGRNKNQHFFNLVIMPTVRFTLPSSECQPLFRAWIWTRYQRRDGNRCQGQTYGCRSCGEHHGLRRECKLQTVLRNL